MKETQWADKHIIVTGGASFIGSYLIDKLVELRANVTLIDNCSSGTLENLSQSLHKINIIKMDLEWGNLDEIVDAFKDHEAVFHLAATHGGLGTVNAHRHSATVPPVLTGLCYKSNFKRDRLL